MPQGYHALHLTWAEEMWEDTINAIKLQSRQIWIVIIFPSWLWTGISNRFTSPKATTDSESWEHSLNKLNEFKKNGCKIFVIEYGTIDNCQMAPLRDLFINLGEMERILGIRVKIQVIPPPVEWDPNSITKTCWYCKHHINYSSKICYIQHKSVINLDHHVMLAMTDGSCQTHGVSTLHQEYFDLKSSEDGHIFHGVFVHAWILQLAGRQWILSTCVQTRKQRTRSLIAHLHGGIGNGLRKGLLRGL